MGFSYETSCDKHLTGLSFYHFVQLRALGSFFCSGKFKADENLITDLYEKAIYIAKPLISAKAANNLAMIYLKRGEYEMALKMVEKSAKLGILRAKQIMGDIHFQKENWPVSFYV